MDPTPRSLSSTGSSMTTMHVRSKATDTISSNNEPSYSHLNFDISKTAETVTATTTNTITAAIASASRQRRYERSAVVLALFGPSVGPCVGDFSTTYRVKGRMYVAMGAILFYSNLFGFERRLCLRFSDIESIELHRSTSIKINMIDCDDYIFRKFQDREGVLRLLLEILEQCHFQRNASIGRVNSTTSAAAAAATAAENQPISPDSSSKVDMDADLFPELPSLENSGKRTLRERLPSDTEVPRPEHASETLRQRSYSMPSIETLEAIQNEKVLKSRSVLTMDATPIKRRKVFQRTLSALTNSSGRSISPDTKEQSQQQSQPPPPLTLKIPTPEKVLPVDPNAAEEFQASNPLSPTDTTDLSIAWDKVKEPYSEVALNKISMNCSLESFMDLFFSNDASYPISKYQLEVIKDRDVFYSKWKKRPDSFPPTFDREISFIHPLNNAVGPSQANTSRQQSFRRFGNLGAMLQNKTQIQGVPGADCFTVNDRWIVEAISETTVELNVTFQVDFNKRTMFKSIIQKNTKSETKKWFQGYANYAARALYEEFDKKGPFTPTAIPEPTSSSASPQLGETMTIPQKEETGVPFYLIPGLLGIIVLMSFLLLIHLFYLHRSIEKLESQILLLLQDNQELKKILQDNVVLQ